MGAVACAWSECCALTFTNKISCQLLHSGLFPRNTFIMYVPLGREQALISNKIPKYPRMVFICGHKQIDRLMSDHDIFHHQIYKSNSVIVCFLQKLPNKPVSQIPWFIRKNISQYIIFSCDQAALQMVFSVCLSVCPSVRLSHLFDYVPIIVSSWNFQKLSPRTRVRSMQKVKVRGQRSRSQRSQPNFPFPDCNSSLNSHMMMKWYI